MTEEIPQHHQGMPGDMEEHVLHAIKQGNIKMRSRWYFRLRDILAVIAIVIIILIAVFFASFIIFVLHQSGAWFVPVFGLAGWYALFSALPWILILLSLFFIMILAFLMKQYPLGYQWPLLYSFLGLFFLIAATSFIFIQTSFYQELFGSPIPADIPFLNSSYPGVGIGAPQGGDIHHGTIVGIVADGFILKDISGRLSPVIVSSDTSFPLGDTFELDDLVVVFGGRTATGTIIAEGVEKVAD